LVLKKENIGRYFEGCREELMGGYNPLKIPSLKNKK
jgi:hypothetical protein